MRLFIAIPLSAPLRKLLQELQQALPSGIRKQQARQMHITLRFLGETSPQKAKQLNNKLADINSPSFSLQIQDVGAFPQQGKPKVVWAGISKSKSLIQLQKKIEKVCVTAGFKTEKRTFTPHITLGRVKNAEQQAVKNWINQNEHRSIATLSVQQFILFESQQRRDGVIHQALEHFNI